MRDMRTLSIKSLLTIGACVMGIAIAQDPGVVAKSVYHQKLANKRVRVFEIVFRPGQSIPMHAHPDHVVYVVTAGTLEITEKGKKPIKLAGKPGDTFFLPAQAHSAKNIGKSQFKAVVVELR
jgi:beta-alanine degradation protein BauB